MLGIERVPKIGHLLIEFGHLAVHEMVLTPRKIQWLWEECQKYPTLFSDLTKGDIRNFISFLETPGSYWMEVYDTRHLVGIIYVMNLDQITDCDCHMIFFDRKATDKVPLCRALVRWMFKEFRLHRLSAPVPAIYHATIRLVKNIGFKLEGTKRETLMIGGRWVDELQFGILEAEMD